MLLSALLASCVELSFNFDESRKKIIEWLTSVLPMVSVWCFHSNQPTLKFTFLSKKVTFLVELQIIRYLSNKLCSLSFIIQAKSQRRSFDYLCLKLCNSTQDHVLFKQNSDNKKKKDAKRVSCWNWVAAPSIQQAVKSLSKVKCPR